MKKILLIVSFLMLICAAALGADAVVLPGSGIIDGVIDVLKGVPNANPYVEGFLKWSSVVFYGLTGVSFIIGMVNAGLKAANKSENGVLAKIAEIIAKGNEYLKYISLRNAAK